MLAPLAEIQQHYLVTLSRPGSRDPVHIVLVQPLLMPGVPSMRDVLWWLAGDSWAIRQSGASMELWAMTHGHPPGAEATARLHQGYCQQARALEALLGQADYDRLLAVYDAEVAPTTSRTPDRG